MLKEDLYSNSDDRLIRAGTICHAGDALAEAGAVEVYASCTHPVLSGPAMDNISQSAIRKLVVLIRLRFLRIA